MNWLSIPRPGRQPNRLSACVFVLAFNLLRFLHLHHTHSVNTRYLCGSGLIEPRAKTEALTATDTSQSKELVFRVRLSFRVPSSQEICPRLSA
jgi:hypothetical protein